MNIPIDDIELGDRARVEYKNIPELAESLKEKGFIQPLVVDDACRLVCGGRRLQAAKEAGMTEVPVILRKDCDLLTLRELELEENLQREDLTWQEEVKAKKEIDALQKVKHGNKELDRTVDGWSLTQTAKLLGQSTSGLSRDIALADAIEQIPELAGAKDKAEATKTFKKILEKAARKTLIERAKEEHDSVRFAANHYMLGDAIAGMKSLDQTAAWFAEVDPPYGVDFKELRGRKRDGGGKPVLDYNEVRMDNYPDFLADTAEQVYRITNDNAWVIWWFATKHYDLVYNTLELAGFAVDAVPGVWYKEGGSPGATMQPEILLARNYETFFIGRKGRPLLNKRGRGNVFAYKPVNSPIHPTEKPIELMREIVDVFCYPGCMGVIPFMGSGVTLRALYQHGMRGFGWDLSEEYRDSFLGRVLEEKDQGLYELPVGTT